MHILFVCTVNRLRSPTAETLFRSWPGITVASAGIDRQATTPIDEAMIEAADAIIAMERHHKDGLRKKFKAALGNTPVYVLDIPDEYERDQPELIALLQQRVPPLLEILRSRFE